MKEMQQLEFPFIATELRIEDGFYVFNKGTDALLSYHFKADEFSCHCTFPECREQRVAVALIEKLEKVRVGYGYPIAIDSGCRCTRYQAFLRDSGFETSKKTSTHELPKCTAADIRARQMTLLVPIVKQEFETYGLAATWMHVDLRVGKEACTWTYKHG